MLAEAHRRTTASGLPLELHHGDITSLPPDGGTFDGACSERVFRHLDEPRAAMAELARVTRPGGRIAVIDSDWGMHASSPTLARKGRSSGRSPSSVSLPPFRDSGSPPP
jgi:ubiquinone/menaquinone biosynthesis C-methylase UbiE